MLDLNLLIEEVLKKLSFEERLKQIHSDLQNAILEYRENKKLHKNSKIDLNTDLFIYNSKRIELRERLAELLKGQFVLNQGKRSVKTHEDLDEYIWNKEGDKLDRYKLEGLINLRSSDLPNSYRYKGLL
jgi:hypothetical protein